MVVPWPGASDKPRAEPWEHAASSVDNKGNVACSEFKCNKKNLTRICSAFYCRHMPAVLNNAKGKILPHPTKLVALSSKQCFS